MTISIELLWSNSPLPINKIIENPDVVVNLPVGGTIITNAGAVSSVNGKTGIVTLTASDVGATTQAYVDAQDSQLLSTIGLQLADKADLVNGTIPASQLPSYVDDVLDFPSINDFPVVGDAGKIYIDDTTNKTYRWAGSSYVEISSGGVALGETASTAYRGDRGKIAYDHSQTQGNPHNTTSGQIAEVGNLFFTDARVRATQLTGLSTADSSSVVASDSILQAIGKLQAKSAQSGGATTWVNVTTLTGFTKNANVATVGTLIEVAKFDGLLWVRGFVTTSNSIAINTELFSWNDTNYLWDYVPRNSTFAYDTLLNRCSIFESVDYQLKISQNYSGTGTHRLRFFANQAYGSAIAKGVIPPTAIGKAL